MASSGMSSTRQVVVDFKLLSSDAAKNIQDLNVKIGNLKAVLEGMKRAGLENSEQYARFSAVLKEMKQAVKANEKVLVENVKEQKSSGDSINAMRSQLKLLRQEYEDLSKAEREGVAGKELLKSIDTLTTSLKELEFAQQDFSRQIGEYDVVSKPARTALREMRKECQDLAGALQAASGKIQAQEQVVKSLADTLGTASQEYKDAVVELDKLNASYDTTQKELTAIEQKAGELTSTLAGSNKRIQAFASSEQKIAAMQEGVDLLSSAFTVLQGSMAALGVESKSLLEIYAKIQIVQQSLNSVMAIYKALNKDSNLMIALRMKLEKTRLVWTKAYNAALVKQNVEVGANTVAQAANATSVAATATAEVAATGATFSLRAAFEALKVTMMSNPVTAVALAIAASVAVIIKAVKKLSARNKEAAESAKKHKEEQEALTKTLKDSVKEQVSAMSSVAGSRDEEIARIKSLVSIARSEISTYDQKSKALRELNRIVPEYNGYLDKTGKLVEGNTNKLEEYVNALERKARAEGFASLLVEEYKKAAEIEREIFLHTEKMGQAQEKMFKDQYENTVDAETIAAMKLANTEQGIIDGLKIDLAEQQKRIQAILDIAGQYVDASSLVSRDNVNVSPAKKETEKEDDQKEIEDAKKMFSELQKSAREYYESVEKLQDGALETMLRNENDRYMNELGVLTDAYNKAVDLSLKDADFLKKAGIDPEALKRYIKELSKAMDEASDRNKANRKKIEEDHRESLDRMKAETDAAFTSLQNKINGELERESKSKIELARLELENQLAALDEEMKAELAAHEYTEEQKTELTELYNKKRQKLVRDSAKKEKLVWMESVKSVLDSVSAVTSSMSSLFGVLADNDEKMQKYSNALALVDIMVSMAQGIATAVAEGMKTGWPAAAVMIPAGIATVVSGIASAISLFRQNDKVGGAPKFAAGGLVKGPGTGTSDSVDIKASSGEYIIKQKIVEKYGIDFFDALNFEGKNPFWKFSNLDMHFATGGVVPDVNNITSTMNIDYGMMRDVMRESMADALSEMPNPVVSVKEITRAQNRVLTKERIARE